MLRPGKQGWFLFCGWNFTLLWERKRRTPNAERPTSNAEKRTSEFGVRCWALDVCPGHVPNRGGGRPNYKCYSLAESEPGFFSSKAARSHFARVEAAL